MNGSDSTSTKERLVWKTPRFEIKIRTGYDIRLERERGGESKSLSRSWKGIYVVCSSDGKNLTERAQKIRLGINRLSDVLLL